MNIPYVFKKCSKCGRWLVANNINFYKSKRGKYGLYCWCKECMSIYNKKYYGQHREEHIERNKKYKEEHKEVIAQYYKKYNKNYYEENKEVIVEYMKNYYEENKEKIVKYREKYNKTPQGQANRLNDNTKRRQREEQQGKGLTGQQWLEMMKFFDFKCAYSGEYIGGKENQSIRSIDHIVPLAKGGLNEIWNCVPMYRSLNSSKCNSNIEEWYPQQDFYNEDRLNKINKWCKYAYNKWGKEVNTKAI